MCAIVARCLARHIPISFFYLFRSAVRTADCHKFTDIYSHFHIFNCVWSTRKYDQSVIPICAQSWCGMYTQQTRPIIHAIYDIHDLHRRTHFSLFLCLILLLIFSWQNSKLAQTDKQSSERKRQKKKWIFLCAFNCVASCASFAIISVISFSFLVRFAQFVCDRKCRKQERERTAV